MKPKELPMPSQIILGSKNCAGYEADLVLKEASYDCALQIVKPRCKHSGLSNHPDNHKKPNHVDE